MTTTSSKNRSVKIDATRAPTVLQQAEVYQHDSNAFTGLTFPNPGDFIVLMDSMDEYLGVTATDPGQLKWVCETRTGNPYKAMGDFVNRMDPAYEPVAEGTHRRSTAISDIPLDLGNQTDKGLLAKAKLGARRAARRTAKIFRWTVTLSISLLIIAAAIIVTYAYKTMETGRFTDERSCSVKLGGDLELTGKRSYTYRYNQILGYRFIDTRKIFEKTTLDLRNQTMTVVGQYTRAKPVDQTTGEVPAVEERWWGINIDGGDRGQQILKGADNYTFVVGKKIGVIKYEEFCKG